MLSLSSNYVPNTVASTGLSLLVQTEAARTASTTLAPQDTQAFLDELSQRPTNLGAGIGVALRKLFGYDRDDAPALEPIFEPKERTIVVNTDNTTEPFLNYYEKIFAQDTIRVVCVEQDFGVDDGSALLQLLAAKKNGGAKKVEIVAVVPCVGNAILAQTEQNALQFLELTDNQAIPVYPGAVSPLAIENNQTAIALMNQDINATHFYGHDGEADVGGWPKVKMQMQQRPGYLFVADAIMNTPLDAPLTLTSTAALTELSKTLSELQTRDPSGSFAQKISAISVMGGCINPEIGCNAPFNVPDSEKTSEANFYFDSPAAKIVFEICQQYRIPILLAPLDLTQQPGLLWTKGQVSMLHQTGNRVARQWAKVTNVVPYLDAPCFPNGTYPMHDLQAVTNFLFPDFYTVTRVSATIGDIGQMNIDLNGPDEDKNIYIFSMPVEKQEVFYQSVLSQYRAFDKKQSSFSIGMITGIAALAIAAIGACVLGLFCLSKWLITKDTKLQQERLPLLPETSSVV